MNHPMKPMTKTERLVMLYDAKQIVSGAFKTLHNGPDLEKRDVAMVLVDLTTALVQLGIVLTETTYDLPEEVPKRVEWTDENDRAMAEAWKIQKAKNEAMGL